MDFENMKKDKDFQKWCFEADLVGNKEWFNLENGSGDEVYIAYEAWIAGQQRNQAEIDALKAELAKCQKDGYKLIPVEPSKEKLKEIEEKCFEHPDCFGIDCPLDVIYRTIAGE